MDDIAAARLESSLTYLRDRFAALRATGPIRGAMVADYSLAKKTLDDVSEFIGGPRENALPLASRITSNWYLSEAWGAPGLSSAVKRDIDVYVWDDDETPLTIDHRDMFFHCKGDKSPIAAFEAISEHADAVAEAVAHRLGGNWCDTDVAQCSPGGADWWWLIFHAAAARLPGCLLRLSSSFHRMEDGTFAVMEVVDMVEASIMLIDAARAAPPVIEPKATPPKVAHAGGARPERRPRKDYPEWLFEDVIKARETYETKCERQGLTAEPKYLWLRNYCRNRKPEPIDVDVEFPAAFDGEEWPERAKPFWDAVRQRKSRAERKRQRRRA